MIAAVPAQAVPADLGSYLRARVADADRAGDIAVEAYGRALAATPGNADVALHAYREGVDAGDLTLIERASVTLRTAGKAPPDVALFALALAARRHDPRAIQAALAELDKGALNILVPALRGWAAFEDKGDVLAPLAAAPRDSLALRFAQENRALLLIAVGKSDDGVVSLRALIGTDAVATDLRLAAAQLLVATGQRDRLGAVLVGNDPRIAAFRVAPEGIPPSLRFGVSRLFARVAADLATGDPGVLVTALLRASLAADPGDDSARLLLADQLARRGLTARALAVLDGVPASSPFADLAGAARVDVLAADGRAGEALVLARRLADTRGGTIADTQKVGELLAASGQDRAAAAAFRRVLERTDTPGWAEYLQYGGALERAGDWPAGRAALAKAVALAPDEPLALNYLGYAQVERGENLAAARALLERAAKLRPNDPAIADSLGWAYFRGGEPARALPLLERAAAGAPTNAVIGEHLGDAYWQAGRRYEARYAWRAAQVVAEPADAARLAAKIDHGPAARP